MSVDPTVFLTILGMAAVTYATRATGVWLASRFVLSPRLRAWLDALPGAIIVSIVAPAVVNGGAADATAAIATGLVAWRTRSLLPAVATGVAAVVILRSLLPR